MFITSRCLWDQHMWIGWQIHPGFPGTLLVLALKIQHSGNSLSPWKTTTVSNPTCGRERQKQDWAEGEIKLYCRPNGLSRPHGENILELNWSIRHVQYQAEMAWPLSSCFLSHWTRAAPGRVRPWVRTISVLCNWDNLWMGLRAKGYWQHSKSFHEKGSGWCIPLSSANVYRHILICAQIVCGGTHETLVTVVASKERK